MGSFVGQLVSKGSRVVLLTPKDNGGVGDDRIEWTECSFVNNGSVQTLTIDKKVASLTSEGCIEDLIIQVTEEPKPYKNGKGAFLEKKFRIVGIDSKKPTTKPAETK